MTDVRIPTVPAHPSFRDLLAALSERPHMRRELNELTGNINAPDLVYELRARGWELVCERIITRDRYGHPVQAGRYSMTTADRQHWIEIQAKGAR